MSVSHFSVSERLNDWTFVLLDSEAQRSEQQRTGLTLHTKTCINTHSLRPTVNIQITEVYLLCNGSVAMAENSWASGWSQEKAKLVCVCVFVKGAIEQYKDLLCTHANSVCKLMQNAKCTTEDLFTGGSQQAGTHSQTCACSDHTENRQILLHNASACSKLSSQVTGLPPFLSHSFGNTVKLSADSIYYYLTFGNPNSWSFV